jgi:hypothetical protein
LAKEISVEAIQAGRSDERRLLRENEMDEVSLLAQASFRIWP